MEDSKDKKKKLVHYVFLLLFIVAVVLFLATAILFGMYVYVTVQKGQQPQEYYGYRSLDVKKYQSGEKSICDNFVTVNHELFTPGHNDLFLYNSMILSRDVNEYSFISNFGADRYECTGSCICQSSTGRRSSMVIKGASYFLVAMSSALAINLAKNDFDEVCMSEISEEDCHPSYVLSEVDSCSRLNDCTDTCTDYTQYENQKELEINVDHKPEECPKKIVKGDTISVHYTGRLTNGKVFDSSVPRGTPLEFQVGVGMVIQGWDQGLIGACEGEKRRLIIPSHLAYGAQGAGGIIPPNAVLIFDVEVIEIKKS